MDRNYHQWLKTPAGLKALLETNESWGGNHSLFECVKLLEWDLWFDGELV